MSKKNFLEFVTNNPPAFLPGQQLYWLDSDTGEIIASSGDVISIVLTHDWKWKIVDPDNGDFIVPNENPYFCTSKEHAKVFRDKLGSITYVVLAPADDGTVISEGKNYNYMKQGTLDVTTVGLDESFLTAIMRIDTDIKESMIITLSERANFLLFADGKHNECFITVSDSKTQFILKEAFDR